MFLYRFQYCNPPRFPENSWEFPGDSWKFPGEFSEISRHPTPNPIPHPTHPFYFLTSTSIFSTLVFCIELLIFLLPDSYTSVFFIKKWLRVGPEAILLNGVVEWPKTVKYGQIIFCDITYGSKIVGLPVTVHVRKLCSTCTAVARCNVHFTKYSIFNLQLLVDPLLSGD